MDNLNKNKEPEEVMYDMTINELDENHRKDFIRKAHDYGKFSMSVNEYYRYTKFIENHRDCRIDPETGKHRCGTIGGGTEVSFEGTGLGYIVKCKCQICGQIADITDSDCW